MSNAAKNVCVDGGPSGPLLEFLDNSKADGWPSTVDLKFITPGPCFYEDLKNTAGETVGGTVLIQKAAFDKMAASIKGKPIINWDHRNVNPKEFTQGKFQGVIISEAKFNSEDGWYHAEGLVWDEATRKNIERGFSISCSYKPTEVDNKPGTFSKVPYDAEVLNGYYTHVAVVDTPRYERATIELLNSAKGGVMGLLSIFKKDKPEEKMDIDMKTPVTLDNKTEVPLEEMVNAWREAEAKKQELANKALEDDRVLDVDGKKVTLKDLKNSYSAAIKERENGEAEAKKKADEEKMNSEHDAKQHDSAPMANCARCNSAKEEADKKADEEKKNSEASKKAEEEKQNSVAKAEAAKKAKELDELRNKGGKVEMPSITTLRDQVAEGQSRYGTVKK